MADLAPPRTQANAPELVVLGAAGLGKARLIDNVTPETELICP
jgi:pantothenate synthetase